MKRTIAIGDIHGCLDTLKNMLEFNIRPVKGDTIIFLGDYVDRGPQSAQVVDFIYNLTKNDLGIEIIALMGNHEDMFLEMLDQPHEFYTCQNCLANGGDRTVQSYVDAEAEFRAAGYQMGEVSILTAHGTSRFFIPAHHITFLEGLPKIHSDENFFYVHAGLRPCVNVADQEEDDLLWIRYEFLYSRDLFDGKRVVHGHTPARNPEQHPNRINIDCGLGKNGDLAAFTHEDGKNGKFYLREHESLDVDNCAIAFASPTRTGGW